MLRLYTRWLTGAVPLVLGVSLITFLLTSLVPGDAARTILGANASPAQVRALDHALGLDRPLPVRYWQWLTHALHGDLGHSVTSGVPVSQELTARAGVTLALIAGAVTVAALTGVGLGTLSALRGGRLGRATDILVMLGLAIPNFWFALVLVTVFAVRIPLFPATGYTPFAQSPAGWLASLVLPVLTLGLTSAAPVAKQAKDGVLAELGRDYVRVLRARGVPEHTVILKHVLRNAATPVVTVLGLVVLALFGGAALAETVFVLPGLGGLAVTATTAHDIPTVQGIVLVLTVIVLLVNLLIETVYAMLNPRIRT